MAYNKNMHLWESNLYEKILAYEKKLWAKGMNFIGGVDEAGRGSFAGPLVSACVCFSPKTKSPENILIDDSKKLPPKKRELA